MIRRNPPTGNKPRQRRRRMGISQILLAKMVDVSLMSVYLWEKEATNPTARNAASLETVLSTLERGEGRCPSGFMLGDDYEQHAECVNCAHRLDCRRYRGYKKRI